MECIRSKNPDTKGYDYMNNRHHVGILCRLFVSLMLLTSCNGQATPQRPEKVQVPEVVSNGQPKLVRTRSSDRYSNIYCALEDKAGNLWFGTTKEGVYRYDGKRFTQFTTTNGLNSDTVLSIMEDRSGIIWFGTANGLCRYDGKTIYTVPLIVPHTSYLHSSGLQAIDPPPRNMVWSMMQDRNGQLWFGTTDGVYRYDGRTFNRFLDDPRVVDKEGLHLKMIDCMVEDANGNVWLASGMPPGMEGICRYDPTTGIITRFKPGGEGWIRRMVLDTNGHLWLGTRHRGTWRYDGRTFTQEKEGLGSPEIVDKAGNIWFSGSESRDGYSAANGIWRFDGTSYTNFTTKDGLGNYGAWCMVQDRTGKIWVGTRNIGLYRFDGTTFTGFSE